jgi:hypothetical protein
MTRTVGGHIHEELQKCRLLMFTTTLAKAHRAKNPKGEAMNKRSDGSLKVKSLDRDPLNVPPKPHVRYMGFDNIEGGRVLRFHVKSNRQDSVELTFDVPYAAFTSVPGISFQDAAPMAYEKLVELLSTGDALDPKKFCLTDADIAHYIKRHLTSRKRAYSMGARGSNVAA